MQTRLCMYGYTVNAPVHIFLYRPTQATLEYAIRNKHRFKTKKTHVYVGFFHKT